MKILQYCTPVDALILNVWYDKKMKHWGWGREDVVKLLKHLGTVTVLYMQSLLNTLSQALSWRVCWEELLFGENIQDMGRVGHIYPHVEKVLVNHILRLERYVFNTTITDFMN